MESQLQITLKRGREQNLYRRHPWIFSGALQAIPEGIQDGDPVEVVDASGNKLGFGHFHHGSISIKLLGFAEEGMDSGFWDRKLGDALSLRRRLFPVDGSTDAYRWVHGEGDGLPGLVIDVYANTVVIQCHSIGMHRQVQAIAGAIERCLGNDNLSIIDKSRDSLPRDYGRNVEHAVLLGSAAPVTFRENGHRFECDVLTGQKTGFFLDQRDNRKLVARYSEGCRVLNAFSYTGGFSVYALAGGAREVISVDSSQRAIEGCLNHLALNVGPTGNHQAHCQDVHDYLRSAEASSFDLIVLDPPAFAKTLDKRHQAVQAYKRLNALAMQKLREGGMLFSFSCSQVVGEELFYHTLVAAGIESRRPVRVIHKLSQAPDHPVNLFHPEGHYLKGLGLVVG
ncbi:MAG: class I SAM-dependent rRNA methyltransferase [Saprospiraceae bacterium]|jgi:23S rRNA (cytosine1962-C5)-methyltransferase|nr:class I SAM-dependent rRNA methyltransferase [Saprospiraceae bacterium]